MSISYGTVYGQGLEKRVVSIMLTNPIINRICYEHVFCAYLIGATNIPPCIYLETPKWQKRALENIIARNAHM